MAIHESVAEAGSSRVVIHIVTVHFRSPVWIDRQLHSIEKYAPGSTTWASLDFIEPGYFKKFTHATCLETEDLGPGIEPYASQSDDPSGDRHGLKLNELARRVGQVADDADTIVFLDGDALLMSPLEHLLHMDLPFTAVRRDENDGDQFPHPSFCMTTVGQWRRLQGDWRRGEYVTSATGRVMTDTGTRLLGQLEMARAPWTPLLRMNTVNAHPVWFGVYGTPSIGPVVYHHGAGFRPRVSRADLVEKNSTLMSTKQRFGYRQRRLDVKMQRRIDRNPEKALRRLIS